MWRWNKICNFNLNNLIIITLKRYKTVSWMRHKKHLNMDSFYLSISEYIKIISILSTFTLKLISCTHLKTNNDNLAVYYNSEYKY